MSVNLYGPSGNQSDVTLYGPSGADTDILRLILDLTAAVKSIQGGFFIAPGAVTDEKVAADAAIAQSKIADLIADLAARATDAELAAETTARTAADNTRLPLAGGTLTGPLVLPANAAAALQAVPKQQLDSGLASAAADLTAEATARATGDNSRLPLAGGTLTGPLVLPGDAATALQAVPRQQLDSGLAARALDTGVVHNTGAETVAGVKTFSAAPVVPAAAFPESAVANLTSDLTSKADAAATTTALNARLPLAGGTMTGAIVLPADAAANLQAVPRQQLDAGLALKADAAATTSALNARALDSAVVHNTGAETIAGIKTFSAAPVLPVGALPESTVTGLVSDLTARALDSAVVHNTGAETIAGVKTFSAAPVVPAAAFPESAVANLTTDLVAKADAAATTSALATKLALAGGTMTGAIVLPGDAAAALQAVPKQQLDAGLAVKADAAATTTALNAKLALAGGTMTGAIVLPGDAAAALQAVPRQQLDAGLAAKLNVTDATTAAELVAAIAAAAAAGGGDVRVARWIDMGTTALTVPDGVNLICTGRGQLVYGGSGVGVTFDSQNFGHSVIRIRRGDRHWGRAVAPDTTSIGIRLRNCNWCTYDIIECFEYETGLELLGAAAGVDAGTTACTINVGRITNNRRGIRFAATTTGAGVGHANGNTFVGGAIRVDGGLEVEGEPVSYAGTRLVDMSTAGNGNTFVGVMLEGSAPEKSVVIAESENVFDGCRVESASTFHFLSTSSANRVLGGYGNFGPDVAPFQDDSAGLNIVSGSRGANFVGDGGAFGSDSAIAARAVNSNADPMLRTLDTAGDMTSELLGSGQSDLYVAGETYPRVRRVSSGGAAGYGGHVYGRGNVAPDAPWGRAATALPAVTGSPIVDLALVAPDGTAKDLDVGNDGVLATVAGRLQLAGVRAGTIYVDDYIADAGATTTTQITDAIQAALAAAKAAGKWCEFAPRAYTINQSLDPTNTLIRAYGATITLAAGSNCYMLACSAGANVTIFGGVWDGNNNAGQQTTGVGFIGYGFYLVAPGPAGLTGKVWLKDLEVRNCVKWAIAISAAQEVRWEHLRFATQSDGIHVHGPCALVYGRGTHGTTTDDMVACTTSDYPENVTTEGDFGIIDIDGLYQAGAAPSFAFLGKTGTKAEVINLRNVRGTAGGMAIRITNDAGSSGNLTGTVVGSLTIDGIEVDNANSVSPIINLNPTRIRNVVITNFIHRNTGIPILVDTAGVVESLKVNGYSFKPLPTAPSEVQTVGLGSATAGTVTVTFDGATTAAIAYNANAAAIQAALVALPNVDSGDIVVTGGPWPATATLTWGGRFTGKNQPQVTVTPTGLTGGTVAVATTTEGGGVAQPLVQNLGRCDELVFESVAATFVSGGKVFQNSGSIHRVSMSNMLTSGGTAVLVQTNTSTPMDVFEANSQFRNLEYGHIIGAVCNLYMANLKFNVIGNYLFYLNDTAGRLRVLAGVIEQVGVTLPQAMAGAATISGNGEMLVMDATGGNQINAARAGDRVWDRITNKPVLYNGSAWVAAY